MSSDDGPVPGEDRGVETQVDDLLDGRLLVAAHRGDADLDLVHADLVEQLGDADLLVVGEDDAGRLLAVAQRGVVDAHGRLAPAEALAMTKLERSLAMVTDPSCQNGRISSVPHSQSTGQR